MAGIHSTPGQTLPVNAKRLKGEVAGQFPPPFVVSRIDAISNASPWPYSNTFDSDPEAEYWTHTNGQWTSGQLRRTGTAAGNWRMTVNDPPQFDNSTPVTITFTFDAITATDECKVHIGGTLEHTYLNVTGEQVLNLTPTTAGSLRLNWGANKNFQLETISIVEQ